MFLTEFLPPAELFVPFLIAALALNLTPGADMTFVILTGARGGPRAGLAATAGVFAGCLVHITLAAAGLSAMIATSQRAFGIVKWLGMLYLCWIAVQMVRYDRQSVQAKSHDESIGTRRAFRQAATINLLNPKVAIFFLAFLPQFVEAGVESPWRQIIALGLVFNFSGILINAGAAISGAAIAKRIGTNPVIGRVGRWIAATVIGALAIRLAASRNA